MAPKLWRESYGAKGMHAFIDYHRYDILPSNVERLCPGAAGPPGGCHNPMAAWGTCGNGEMAWTSTEGNCSCPNARRITSDDIRLSNVTNWPNTCRLDMISPALCCNWRAVDTASLRSIVAIQCAGGRPKRPANSGARHTPRSADEGAASCVPDPHPPPPSGHMMSSGINTPANYPTSGEHPRQQLYPGAHQRVPPGTSYAT